MPPPKALASVALWGLLGLGSVESFRPFVVPQTYRRAGMRVWAGHEDSGPPLLAVVGEPGSGQTTYAKLIAERYGLRTASVSDEGMLEQLRARLASAGGKGIIGSFQKAMSDVMVDRVADLAAVGSGDGGVVLDGWPRTTADLQGLSDKGVSLDRLIYLDTGDEEDGDNAGLVELCKALGPRVVSKVENDDRGVQVVFKDVTSLLDPVLGAGGSSSDGATVTTAPSSSSSSSSSLSSSSSSSSAAAAAVAAPSPPSPSSSVTPPSSPTPNDTKDLMFGGLLVTGPAAASLRGRGITRATPIQEAAMIRIRRGDNVLIHAETGSGKTLAYALPVLQMTEGNAPRQVLVITPTRELAVQVAGEIVSLQDDPQGTGVALLLEPGKGLGKVDAPVVVATAKMMYSEMQGSNSTRTMLAETLANLRCVIMDEVDRCIAPLGAYATLKEKRQKARHPKPASLLLAELFVRQGLTPQFVGASATIGRPLKRELAGSLGVDPKLDGLLTIRADESSPSSSASGEDSSGKPPARAVTIPSSIKHLYLAVPDDDIELKVRAVRDYLNDKRPGRPVVFLPATLSVSDVTMRLKRIMEPHGWDVCALHEALGFGQQQQGGGGRERPTTTTPGAAGPAAPMDWREAVAKHREVAGPTSAITRAQTASTRLLVTSAETARGLDLAGVDCVVVFGRVDGPDEYQHVAGRTGRQGARGVVVSVLSYVDVKKLSAFESMLGIRFKQAVLGNGPMK